MAILLDASTEGLGRASGTMPSGSTWAACGWGYLVSVAGQDDAIFDLADAFGGTDYCAISHNSTNGICLENTDDGGVLRFFTSSPAQATWFFWYTACDATSHRGGWATPGAAFVTNTIGTMTIPTVAEIGIGCYELGVTGTSHSMRHANVKVWSGTIPTDAQLQNEMWSVLPKVCTGLYARWPIRVLAELTDYSGNGYDLSSAGSPTTADGPPVGWGAAPLWINQSGAASRKWLFGAH